MTAEIMQAIKNNDIEGLRLLIKDAPHLDLSHNNIGDAGAEAIAKVLADCKLTCLNLWDNNIGDEVYRKVNNLPVKNRRV